MKSTDQWQDDIAYNIRGLVSKVLKSQFQAILIVTNPETGKVNVECCNISLIQDQRKVLYEALRTIDDSRLSVAISTMIGKYLEKYGGK